VDALTPPEQEQISHEELRAVESEMVSLLYRQSWHAIAFSLMIAAVMGNALWPSASRVDLVVWVTLIVIAFFLRLTVFVAYARAAPTGDAVRAWKWPYLLTLAPASLVWGLGVPWLVSDLSPLHQAMGFVFLVGLAGSALSTYSALRSAALTAFLLTLLPATVWLFATGELLAMSMAVGGVLLAIGGSRATNLLTEILRSNIHLRHEVERARKTAEDLARTDSLTGLYNRRAFSEAGSIAVDYCRRHQLPVTVLQLDLDHFKRINDTFGHAAGDEALRAFGRLLRESLRSSDICGRLGGEEFAVVLPHTPANEARVVAEKLRVACSQIAIGVAGERFGFTVSVGVAYGSYDLEALLGRADEAMYQAKLDGRNRINVSTTLHGIASARG
jgi:diguanylate cyclase (GGDEF)-like protein